MVQKNVWYLKKEYEKTAGRIGSSSEDEDRDAGWRRVWRIFGQDDCVFNGNRANRLSNNCCLLIKNGGLTHLLQISVKS